MNSKHDVKYLIATIALSLTTSTTLSAAEVNATNNASSVTQTLQPITLVESTGKVAIPVLAKPIVIADETIDKKDSEKVDTELSVEPEDTSITNAEAEGSETEVPETQNTPTSTPSEPMPIATDKTNRYIPLLDGALVFANISDELPAVINYYTPASEQEVIDFYQQNFGDAISQERMRGRLTLTYLADDLVKRVIISEQNNKRQVDVIVEQAEE